MYLNSFMNNPQYSVQAERAINDKENSRNKYWDRVYHYFFQRDVTFYARFVSHPQHLPRGMHVYTVHRCDNTPEDKTPTECLCTESSLGARLDEQTGDMIAKPCFFCDLANTIDVDYRAHLDHMSTNDQSMYDAYNKIVPFYCRTYLFPIVVLGKKTQFKKDDKTYTEISPGNDPIYLTLWIGQKDGVSKTNPYGIIGGINNMIMPTIDPMTKASNIHCPYKGSWFQMQNPDRGIFTFGNLQAPTDISGLPGFQEAYSKFPELKKYGQQNNKFKKSILRSYNFQRDLWQNSWWGKNMIQAYGITDPTTWQDEQVAFTAPGLNMLAPPAAAPQMWSPPQPAIQTPPPPTWQQPSYTPPNPNYGPWQQNHPF
jgi:hypothetical protein